MKKEKYNYNILLFISLLISFIFLNKKITLGHELKVSLGLVIYSLTFLFIILTNKKERKKLLLKSSLYLLLFYLICTILCTIQSNIDSLNISNNLKDIFTPNKLGRGNIIIYYPNIYELFVFIFNYLLTHYIFIETYNAIEDISYNYVAFILSLLISFILDQMFYTMLINISNMYYGIVNYIDFIKILTGNFLVVIASSALIILTYPLFIKKK